MKRLIALFALAAAGFGAACAPVKGPAPASNTINFTSNGPADVSVVCVDGDNVVFSDTVHVDGTAQTAVPADSTCALSGNVPPVFSTVAPETCDFTQPCDVTVTVPA